MFEAGWPQSARRRRRRDPLLEAQDLLAVGRRKRGILGPTVASPPAVRADAVRKLEPGYPRPLLSRLVRRRSATPLRLMVLALPLDPLLTSPIRELGVSAKAIRAWLGLVAKPDGQSPDDWMDSPVDPHVYKRMGEAMDAYDEERLAWAMEVGEYWRARGGEPEWATDPAYHWLPRLPLWQPCWYLGATKDALAWSLARSASEGIDSDFVNRALFDFSRNVNDYSSSERLPSGDGWTLAALSTLSSSGLFREGVNSLVLDRGEVLLHVFRGHLVETRDPLAELPPRGGEVDSPLPIAFVTDRRLRIARRDRGRAGDYLGLDHDSLASVTEVPQKEGVVLRRHVGRELVIATEAAERAEIAAALGKQVEKRQMTRKHP